MTRMSAPRSIRIAIEACRPRRVRPLPLISPYSRYIQLTVPQTTILPPRLLLLRQRYSSTPPARAESDNPTSREPQTPPAQSLPAEGPPLETTKHPVSLSSGQKFDAMSLTPQASTTYTPSATLSPAESPTPSAYQPPRNVIASYLAPLRLPAKHGVPVASLQLRS